jgi:protein-L-isoaspartate(D-aspartate) O-methyltransferase
MVSRQLIDRGICDEKVLAAMERVPRHLFVPPSLRDNAYDDAALALAEGQTISQPYIVAYMTERLALDRSARVLEIGTGSGYQAAVLAEIVRDVYTIELREALCGRAREALESLGYHNVHLRQGEGSAGWAEEAPFDGIAVTAGCDRVPERLVGQLAPGGRMIIPVGTVAQRLHLFTRDEDGVRNEPLIGVRFVAFSWPEQ